MVTISPGETAPLMELAAFTTLLMVGSGAVTTRFTDMLLEPVVPVPATTMVPVYVPAPSVPGVAVTVRDAVPVVGVVPLVAHLISEHPLNPQEIGELQRLLADAEKSQTSPLSVRERGWG